MADIHIGSKVWTADPFARRGEDGIVEYEVTGETRVSWVVKSGWREYKLPKKECAQGDSVVITTDSRMGRRQRFFLTEKALEDERWLGRNRWRLGEHISRSNTLSADLLREVAKLVGYVEKGDDND